MERDLAVPPTHMQDLPDEDAPYAIFLESVKTASNETAVRELFVALAATAFSDRGFATSLALGAEYSVSFAHRGLIRRGRIDSFVDNVLIEFKANLSTTSDLSMARDQLAGYVAGAWAEDRSYQRSYLAVATDGRVWSVYSTKPVDPAQPVGEGFSGNADLSLIESWPPGGAVDAASFRRFLNRVFFRKTLLSPTSSNFAYDFGLDSAAYRNVSDHLSRKAAEISSQPQMVLYESAWLADLQVSYGEIDRTGDLFIRHTYLALLARLLVWATLEKRAAEPQDLNAIFDKSYFISRRIGNFVEDDYFEWHRLPSSVDLTPIWSALVTQLATYRLDEVNEDILKPLYEQLIDPEMRHDLGEYYTPDWLAEAIVDRMIDQWDVRSRGLPRVLDPACGSGSFLRAAIHRLRREQLPVDSASARLAQIVDRVQGMDVHPLAVIVAKATYLLTVSDLIFDAQEIIHLPVYLCNSISGENLGRTSSLLGDFVELEVGQGSTREIFPVPVEFVTDGALYDRVISEVVDLARGIGNSRTAAKHTSDAVKFRLSNRIATIPQADVLLKSLCAMGVHLANLIKRGEDSIYGFLLRNRYRSVLLRHQFDMIVGNPPWLTIADIAAGSYRDLIQTRNSELQIAPRSAGEQAHTEIATIFLAQAAERFLRRLDKDQDLLRLGFVLPRSVFSATHHRLLREGTYRPMIDIAEIWDLEGVEPLFNIPSCVLFVAKRVASPYKSKPGREYRGRLPVRDPSARSALDRLRVTEASFSIRRLGKRSAWGIDSDQSDVEETAMERLASQAQVGRLRPQYYAGRFRQGAVLYPQTLLVVEQVGAMSAITEGPVTVRTSETAAKSAKLLKEYRWQGVVDGETLFFTIVADHILPFAIRGPLWTVVLPVVAPISDPRFSPVESDSLRMTGLVHTAAWLDEAEAMWRTARKPNENTPLWERLNHLGHVKGQAERKKYLVMFTASGSRTFAAVQDTSLLDRQFIARDKTYWFSTSNLAEAHYLAAFFNSDYATDIVSDFVTRGLFGKRDTHKRILDIPWPKWNPEDDLHLTLAELSADITADVTALVSSLPPQVGRARSQVRSMVDKKKGEDIERLVGDISKGCLP